MKFVEKQIFTSEALLNTHPFKNIFKAKECFLRPKCRINPKSLPVIFAVNSVLTPRAKNSTRINDGSYPKDG